MELEWLNPRKVSSGSPISSGNRRTMRRVVVFYDFLGWQSHIERAGRDPIEIGFLRRMLLRQPRMLGVKEDLDIPCSPSLPQLLTALWEAKGEEVVKLRCEAMSSPSISVTSRPISSGVFAAATRGS